MTCHTSQPCTLNSGEVINFILPFVNRKYVVDARVIDFYPPRLESFARIRRDDEILDEDDVGGKKSDVSRAEDNGTYVNGNARMWEWAFLLKMVDAQVSDDDECAAVWVVVDNCAACELLGIEASK